MSENGPAPATGDLRASMRASMRASVGPIREDLTMLNRAIEERETELNELRELRRDAERVLKTLDPEFNAGRPKPGPKPQAERKKNVSDAKVDAVLAWLRANVADRDFSVAGLNKGELGPFDVVPPGTLAFAFQQLQDRAAIRLDRIGDAGRKIYRLV